ncbi:fibronectin type III domain-containing protein [Halieaceae bacterium IMCC14734]|uniref:Fibronectin type III domain-containing protein n=1 Tax=Candidatus Litorirhabdus singularis TaxID=2518993 RepID=A0ABT3TMM6_9GAMM|nr:fibronectin type III domain-containing protein [Candidatus Litorirhabdus singularis]MCX2983000.1 fibronectin type III domain-containing protein [Candidatus Litorirhabdus singularis]
MTAIGKSNFVRVAVCLLTGALYSGLTWAEDSQTRPAAPSELAIVSVEADQVYLQWLDNSNVEQGFYILRSDDGVHWDKIDTLKADSREYLDAGLHAASRYIYKVAAFNDEGEVAAFSNLESVITAPEQLDQFEVQVADVYTPYL